MGFRFRKSIKIAPGIRINLTKKGVSSVSIGKRGATVNVGKKGTRGTVGLPGSGLSYSAYKAHGKSTSKTHPQQHSQNGSPAATHVPSTPRPPNSDINSSPKQVSMLLGIGIFIMPIIFAWFTLKQGYSTVSRAVSMVWLVIYILAMR